MPKPALGLLLKDDDTFARMSGSQFLECVRSEPVGSVKQDCKGMGFRELFESLGGNAVGDKIQRDGRMQLGAEIDLIFCHLFRPRFHGHSWELFDQEQPLVTCEFAAVLTDHGFRGHVGKSPEINNPDEPRGFYGLRRLDLHARNQSSDQNTRTVRRCLNYHTLKLVVTGVLPFRDNLHAFSGL